MVITENNYVRKLMETDPVNIIKGDRPKFVINVSNLENLILFDNKGRVFKLPIHKIPIISKSDPGIDIKGVLKGLGGAVIKPISGVFDFVSKTTEGIKNGVNDDRIINRIREPRVFYGMLKVIKEYNLHDAYVKRFLCNEIQEIKENE